MTIGFVFCHGWGLNPNFWQNLLPYCGESPVICWDLGYTGSGVFKQAEPSSQILSDYNWIGVGHSLGFVKLLASDIPFKALIGLQGFIDFFGSRPALRRARARAWQKLGRELEGDFHNTLQQFHQHCGVGEMDKLDLNQGYCFADKVRNTTYKALMQNNSLTEGKKERLKQDFQLFTQSNREKFHEIWQGTPCLILGTRSDPVVTEPLLLDNFSALKNIQLRWHEGEVHHGLGYHDAEPVFLHMINFLEHVL